MRRTAFAFLTLALLAAPALALLAQDFTFAADIPVSLGGVKYNTVVTIHRQGSTYSLGTVFPGLPAGAKIDALDVWPGAGILFTTEAPWTDGTTLFQPGDIVLYKPTAGIYEVILSGIANLGLSASCHIDALSRINTDFVVSFDVPETLSTGSGTATFWPADLVRLTQDISGNWYASMFFRGDTHGLPHGVNLRGVEVLDPVAPDFCFAVDKEVSSLSGGVTAVPGDIVRYSSGTFSILFHDASFPSNAVLTDFSFDSPGRVPDGSPEAPGIPLTIVKNSATPANLDLTWSASCLPAGTNYSVYEGSLGSWSSHTGLACSTSGSTAATVTPSTGDRYYLVVPRNELFEGSYGTTSGATQRPRSATPCVPYQKIAACP